MGVLLLVSLQVKDYAAWKALYDANRPMREKFEMVDDFLSSPRLLDAMASAGVANVPEIRFVLLD